MRFIVQDLRLVWDELRLAWKVGETRRLQQGAVTKGCDQVGQFTAAENINRKSPEYLHPVRFI